jgi:hypothetical protein
MNPLKSAWLWLKANPILGTFFCAVILGLALWAMVKIPWAWWLNRVQHEPSYSGAVWTWAVVTLIAFIAANAIFWTLRSMITGAIDAAMAFSTFWAIAIGSLLFISAFYVYQDQARQVHALLAILAGGLVGWMLGMYISPQGSSERQEFAKIGTAVAGVASGYTLKTVQAWLSAQEHAHYRIYVLYGLISAALTTATIYNVRAYGNGVNITFPAASGDPEDKQKVAAKLNEVVRFFAAVTGPADTSVTWSVIGKTGVAGTIDPCTGEFKAGAAAGTCQVYAHSNADPTLADLVDVSIA